MKVLMMGQFAPPITGEATVNEFVREVVSEAGDVCYVNSSLIESASDVGKFGLIKLFKQLCIYFRFLCFLKGCGAVYLTPGQTIWGLLRFLPVIWICLLFRKRVYSHWHGYGVLYCAERSPHLVRFFLMDRICNIFLTEDLVGKLKAKGFVVSNYQVMKNYHDFDQSEKVLKKLEKINASRLTVLYLGSLMEEKGIVEFIDAARTLRDKFDFIVCGSGGGEILEKVISASNDGYVQYMGVVSGDKKHEILLRSNIFVLQTVYPTEGVPLTILEAQATGNVVVTTLHNGIPETVGDSALYVSGLDRNSLIDQLLELNVDRKKLFHFANVSFEQSKCYTRSVFRERILKLFGLESDF